MLLPDHRIRALVEAGELGISPWRPELLQPASVDVTRGSQFVVNGAPRWCEVTLHPGRFVLGHTTERVRIPDYLAAQVDGKSTWGRRGLLIHSTAGWIDPGFEGQITLELSNVSSEKIVLTAGVPIAQLVIFRMESAAERPYSGKYQGQTGVTPAR
jgi:dCTP deaminase